MRKNGNVVLIAPREELALKEKQQLESQTQISELEPLCPRSFQLNYIKAQDILNLITTNRQQQFGAGAGQTATTGGQGSIMSKRGVAIVDPRIEHPVRAGHGRAARGSAQDHPPDRHADPPGADRGAHRHRQRQVQPAARRALRPADGIHVQQPLRGRPDRQPRTQPVVSPQGARWSTRRATRARRRRSSSRRALRRPGYSDSPRSTSTCRCRMPPASWR